MWRLTTAAALVVTVAARTAAAQQNGATPPPEPIRDNSFLIEEAYNQDPGVVQHISTFAHPRLGAEWAYSFTQEWPVRSMRHQLSATVPVSHSSGSDGAFTGVGDVAVNYRYQLAGMNGEALAVAPRLTMLLPTGSARRGSGAGAPGVQLELPISLELSTRLVTHVNLGVGHTPRSRDAAGNVAATTSYNAGQSLIWLATPRLNLMVEAIWTNTGVVRGENATVRSNALVVSPGVRWAYNLSRGLQIVPGLAWPIGLGPSRGDQSLFAYLSFEHPF